MALVLFIFSLDSQLYQGVGKQSDQISYSDELKICWMSPPRRQGTLMVGSHRQLGRDKWAVGLLGTQSLLSVDRFPDFTTQKRNLT